MRKLIFLLTFFWQSLLLAYDVPMGAQHIGVDLGESFSGSDMEYIDSRNHRRSITKKYIVPHINLYLDYRLDKYLSFEYGIFNTQSYNAKKDRKHGCLKTRGAHAGFVLHVPILNRVELTPGIGVSYLQHTLQELDRYDYRKRNINYTKNHLVTRVLAGTQVQLNDHLDLRFSLVWNKMIHAYYQHLMLDDIFNYNVGLRYRFQ